MPVLDEKCYRLRRFYLHLGIAGTILFLLMGTGCVLAALWNPGESFRYPVPTAIGLGMFFLILTSLGVWCILAYYRERLVITESAVIKYDVTGKTEIRVEAISHIQWSSLAGTIIVESPVKNFKLHIDNYQQHEQLEITDYLRNLIDVDLQEGWDRFQKSNPALFNPADQRPKPVNYVFVSLLLIFAGIFFYAWWSGRRPHFLLISLMNLGVALWWLNDFRKKRTPVTSGQGDIQADS